MRDRNKLVREAPAVLEVAGNLHEAGPDYMAVEKHNFAASGWDGQNHRG